MNRARVPFPESTLALLQSLVAWRNRFPGVPLRYTQGSFPARLRRPRIRQISSPEKTQSLGARYLEVGEKRRLLQSTLDFGLTCHLKESFHSLL
jgi:hypothetical protein